MIAGFIINKFHGDSSVLKSAINYLEKRTAKPVLGVMPYINDIYLPEEDTIALTQEEISDFQSKKENDSENKNLEESFIKLEKIFKENIDLEKIDNIIFG